MTPPTLPQDKGFFCPVCGSPAVDIHQLAGMEATCRACPWKGPAEDLAVFHFSHDMGSSEQMTSAFLGDVIRLMSKEFALPLAKLLIKWGFLDATVPNNPIGKMLFASHLGRYVSQAATAAAAAILRTREAIEVESKGGKHGG